MTTQTYGHNLALWEQAKQEAIRAILIHARTRPIFYSELTTHIGSIAFDPHRFDFHELLYQISAEEDAAGRGLISALVVHKHDGMPGQGFFDMAQTLGRDITNKEQCWT